MTSHPAPVQILQFSALRPRAVATPTPQTPSIRRRQAAATSATNERAGAEESKEFQAGWRQENRRWAAVIYSSAFASNPAIAAHLLAKTEQPASAIISLLGKVAADAAAAPVHQQAAIADRWAAAAQRAGIA